jgi:hypothetical protein
VVLSDTYSAFHNGKRIVRYAVARTKKYVLGIRRHGAYWDGRTLLGLLERRCFYMQPRELL